MAAIALRIKRVVRALMHTHISQERRPAQLPRVVRRNTPSVVNCDRVHPNPLFADRDMPWPWTPRESNDVRAARQNDSMSIRENRRP
jgi:hypothetical protein